MALPQLKDQDDNTQDLPYPANPLRELMKAESQARTLYGTTKTDFLYQKWRYIFQYPDMTDSDYNTIKSFIDSATTLYLSWTDRYSDCDETEVHATMTGPKDFVGTGKLITTEFQFEEVDKRS